ncbi:sigma-70 family RNA polymerase sigma factor [Mesorhizobium sp.]|uniref:sigma-70 family RNA polymerase sigma factor n=1 Tax=Mesorhizobium sp. TaxID=1871066 RepID=UPI0025CCCDA0|nr:sigma-70 family RNA polymerase sigma factor [Mesorhizobium sp.]
MVEAQRNIVSHLRLVPDGAQRGPASLDDARQTPPRIRDVDWTILMARAQDGDSAAYLRLLEETTPYLRSLASRWYRDQRDIEDAVQDVFLTVHAIRHTYDPARPFGPWLVAIARRRFVDRLRRNTRQRAHEAPLTAEHETFAESEANIEESVDRIGLDRLIERLPPKQQQAVSLLKLKEMSLKEAAKVSGMSIVSLKVATHRALKGLRRMLTDGKDA